MPVRRDSSRSEIAADLDALASLIRRHLPRRVDANTLMLNWETTSALLLARIARQSESIGLLIRHGHDSDATAVARSLLEHLTLFAWLAIEPADESRAWRARNPADNTLWWMASQVRREKKNIEDQHVHLGLELSPHHRAALKAAMKEVAKLNLPAKFPEIRERAEEVDAHWSRRIDGWQTAEPGETGVVVTFRGHYWTLFYDGSAHVHPSYTAIRRFLGSPRRSGYQRHYIQPEPAPPVVGVGLAITAYLVADAIAIADEALGWDAYDDALRVLDRWDEVRAPNLLLDVARRLLGRRRRRFGRADGALVRVETRAHEMSFTKVLPNGDWSQLRNTSGTRLWHRDLPDGTEDIDPRKTGFELGPAVREWLDLLADARRLSRKPRGWPADLGEP